MYFSNIISENLKVDVESLKLNPDYFIKQRKNRELIKNSFKLKKFLIGDILEFVYSYRSIPLVFCGICIAIKRKSFVMPDLVLILRNIIIRTGIELTLSYFYNRGYKFKYLDYRRKFFIFNKNKLYFIRYRDNQESRIF